MSDEFMLYLDDDGVARHYDDTYDITIHCESEEEQEKAIELIKSRQWIPCSERLPEDHEPKLLTHEVHYISGKVIKDVRMAYYDDENDDWLSDEESPEILCYPLAWMPLPEPYKEEP